MRATGQLLRRRGFAATGLSEIIATSGAPRGSLYFHFPGGKEELAVAAMARTGQQLRELIEGVLASSEDLGVALGRLLDALASGLERSNYADGCPIATVALESATESEELRAAAASAFDSWLLTLAERLSRAGLEPAPAATRALLVLSSIEGALILARTRRSLEPLVAVRDELIALIGAPAATVAPGTAAPLAAAPCAAGASALKQLE